MKNNHTEEDFRHPFEVNQKVKDDFRNREGEIICIWGGLIGIKWEIFEDVKFYKLKTMYGFTILEKEK